MIINGNEYEWDFRFCEFELIDDDTSDLYFLVVGLVAEKDEKPTTYFRLYDGESNFIIGRWLNNFDPKNIGETRQGNNYKLSDNIITKCIKYCKKSEPKMQQLKVFI
jgi:hypothetical protein